MMEITKREIIASIAIISIMLIIGIIISEKISNDAMDSKAKYNKAAKIDKADLFKYGMDTNIGNAFVYGILEAKDPVTYPEIGGKYLSVEKVTKRYTMHTKVVTNTVNGKTTTHIENYWTWDTIDTDRKQAYFVTFCGIDFNYAQFNKQYEEYIKTIKEGNIKYVYSGCDYKLEGTVFAFLEKGNFGQDGATFYEGQSIKETVEKLNTSHAAMIFWIAWIFLIIAIITVFYQAENRWLENKS